MERIRWAKSKGRANHALHATWLIGALFEFFHPHCGRFAGEHAHAAPAKRVKATVSAAVTTGRVVV